MTNRELGEKLGQLAREERRITHEILKLINIGLERRAYLELGFSSMFDWLVRGFGYSNAAAYRRIEAAKLLKAVPEAVEKFKEGHVNLTTLSKAQTAIKVQERATGQKVALEVKTEIVQQLEGKTSEQTDRLLKDFLPEAALEIKQNRKLVIDSETTRYFLNFGSETQENLKRAKEVLSHKMPLASDSEVIAYALKFFLEQKDPLSRHQKESRSEKSLKDINGESEKAEANGTPFTSVAEAVRVKEDDKCDRVKSRKRDNVEFNLISKQKLRLQKINEHHAQCSYKDPVTGRSCHSRYQLELDHIHPKSLGGTNESENLRPLCRQHNLMMAEKVFGREYMLKFRSNGV